MNIINKKKEYTKKWLRKHPEARKRYIKNAIAKKPEYYKEMQHKKYLRWKKEKPEQLKEIQRRANKKYALKKTWLKPENKIKSYIRIKEWIKNNPEKIKIIRKRAKAKRRGVVGSYTLAEWELLLKQYAHTCPCCERDDVELHADHIIPIIKGGSNFIENIQPLCKSCNSSKYTKIIFYPPKQIIK